MDIQTLETIVEASLELECSFFETAAAHVLEAGRIMAEAVGAGHKILAFGNGGSAPDAQNLSGSFRPA